MSTKIRNSIFNLSEGGLGSRYWTQLPQKLIVTSDVLVDEMDATTGWTTTRANLESNTTQVHSGTASIKMTSTTAGQSSVMDKTVSLNLSGDNGRSFRLWIYPHTQTTVTYTAINIILGSDSSFSNSFTISYLPDTPQHLINTWTMLWGNNWSVLAGNPSWNNIVAIRIKITNAVGQVGICSFDLATEGVVIKPSILLMLDDGNDSDYTKAYPLIKAKKMVATSYIVSSLRGAGYLTDNQLLELNANKWDIGNHTVSHPLVAGAMTPQDFVDEMEGCRVFLDGLGLTRASKHVGATGSAYCADWVTAAGTWGAKTLRPGSNDPNIYSTEFPYHINAGGQATPTLVATKAYIDKALLNKWTPICYFHKIVDSGASGTEWLTSNFSLLLDYIELLGLQSLTIDEYYRLNSGPITVHHK
ncbi:MAG: polysaccharide deacetylase family protein [Prolixibacteraceae bacterium]|nr:polysaccharide deacetylase family protein [Prolixibacteraceae bacterium]